MTTLRSRVVLATLACLFAGLVRLDAHPVATTVVAVNVNRDGHVLVTVTTDPESMIAKLEALSGQPPSPGDATKSTDATATLRVSRLSALGAVLAGLSSLELDARPVPLAMQSVVIDAAGQAVIQLSGTVSAAPRHASWAARFVYGSYPVSIRSADGQESVQWLAGPERSAAFVLGRPAQVQTAIRAAQLGYTHILPKGIDHILFVVGLFLLSARPKPLLAQVTTFTIAHSITLGLGLYGVFSLPAAIVEPMIALSVAYVGVENLLTSRLQPWRLVVVFCFGLLHGLGFAEALANLHLARGEFLATLVSFNLGVEAGQLSVIAGAAIIVWLATRARAAWRRPLVSTASAAIGITGLVWTVQRLL